MADVTPATFARSQVPRDRAAVQPRHGEVLCLQELNAPKGLDDNRIHRNTSEKQSPVLTDNTANVTL